MAQAASLGSYGRGFAVVAKESRAICERMDRMLDAEYSEEFPLRDMANQMIILSLNASLEVLHMVKITQLQVPISKSLAVCAEEIRLLAMDVSLNCRKGYHSPKCRAHRGAAPSLAQ